MLDDRNDIGLYYKNRDDHNRFIIQAKGKALFKA